MFPLRVANCCGTLGRDLRQVSAVDIVLALAEALPTGCIRATGSSATCGGSCSDPDRTNDFRELACELYLAATDLDTCERVVFGVRGL